MGEVVLNFGRLQIQSKFAALERALDRSGDRITVSKVGEQQKLLAIDAAVINRVFEAMHGQVNTGPGNLGQRYARGLPARGHRIADDVDLGSQFADREDHLINGILQVQ